MKEINNKPTKREKWLKRTRKKITSIDQTGKETNFESILEAERHLKIKGAQSNIRKVLNSPTRKAYSFSWVSK